MSARILIVDDNALNVKLLAARLGREYYTVMTAKNGEEALEVAKREIPDLILLDVMMPGIDGYGVCEQLRRDTSTQHIPIVMVTALTEAADRVRGLESGADDFISKPIDDQVLLARVRSLLRLKLIMDEWRTRQGTTAQLGGELANLKPDTVNTDQGKILLLTDDSLETQLLTNSLTSLAAKVTTAQHLAELKELALKGEHEVLLLGLGHPSEETLRMIPFLRSQDVTRQTPILLIGQPSDQEILSKALDLGANDYLLRPLEVNELIARVRTQLKQKRYYEKLRSSYQQSLQLALTDPLTTVFNRRYFDMHLPRLLMRCQENQKPLSMVMVDADHFKMVNDTYGHTAGDEVLRKLAQIILHNVRAVDCVARLGGEEFAIILPETDLQTAHFVAERLRDRVHGQPFVLPGHQEPIKVTVSIGVAERTLASNEPIESLMERTDAALYDAKHQGRNHVSLAKPIGA